MNDSRLIIVNMKKIIARNNEIYSNLIGFIFNAL